MIITISGLAGSGKSTIAKLLAKELNYKFYSTGYLQRQVAEEMGVTINELGKLEKSNPEIDKKIDNKTKELAKQDNFVIDSWLAAFFIPKAFKIFLTADLETRAKRRLNQKRKTEAFENIDEVKKALKEREETNRNRWLELYGFDFKDKSNYDLVVDTTNLTIEEVKEEILKHLA